NGKARDRGARARKIHVRDGGEAPVRLVDLKEDEVVVAGSPRRSESLVKPRHSGWNKGGDDRIESSEQGSEVCRQIVARQRVDETVSGGTRVDWNGVARAVQVVLVIAPCAGNGIRESAVQPVDLVRDESILRAEPAENLQLAEVLGRKSQALVDPCVSDPGTCGGRVENQGPAVFRECLLQVTPVLERTSQGKMIRPHVPALRIVHRKRFH